MRRLLILAACGALTACATDHVQPPSPTIVQVPVPVHCTPAISAAPDYPDTDAALAAAPDLFSRVQLLVAGRLLRMARERELQAALQGCTG